jgi:hypothetical protein
VVASNIYYRRPSKLWHVEVLLSVYGTILAIFTLYSFSVGDYWSAFLLIWNAAVIAVTALGLLISTQTPYAWNATLAIAVVEPVILGWALPMHLSTMLFWALVLALTFSPLIILTLTDLNLEVFFGKEFAYMPAVQSRANRRP